MPLLQLVYVECVRSLTVIETHSLSHTHSYVDKHSNSGSYSRRGHLETPPTYSYPIRHSHHHPSSRGSCGKPRKRKRGGRERIDESSHGKVWTLCDTCGTMCGQVPFIPAYSVCMHVCVCVCAFLHACVCALVTGITLSSGLQLASLPAQCDSVRGEGRKKMSLNHLLNFTLSPRETHGGSSGGGGNGPVARRRYKLHSYNKEQFLQAK